MHNRYVSTFVTQEQLSLLLFICLHICLLPHMTANLDEHSIVFNWLNIAPSSLSVKGVLKKC